MNKNDLIDAVTERTSLAKSDAARAVEAVLGSITEALQKGDAVSAVRLRHVRDQGTRCTHGPQSAHRRAHRHSGQQGAQFQGWKRL